MNITTPALLFPALSLLLLAYTNRFLVIAQLIRSLYKQNQEDPSRDLKNQIFHLRVRIEAIRRMQVFGVMAFMGSVITMFALFFQWTLTANIIFCISLALLLTSLSFCLYEVYISGQALNLQLKNLEER